MKKLIAAALLSLAACGSDITIDTDGDGRASMEERCAALCACELEDTCINSCMNIGFAEPLSCVDAVGLCILESQDDGRCVPETQEHAFDSTHRTCSDAHCPQ
jgi:hypothetical protein